MIVIVLENHTYPAIIGRAPFITSLAHRCGLAADYHHNAKVSLPNYLAMTSGSTHGLRRNCTPKQCSVRGPSIFTQLAAPPQEVARLPGVDAGPVRPGDRPASTPPGTTRPSTTGGSDTASAAATSSRSARAAQAPCTRP